MLQHTSSWQSLLQAIIANSNYNVLHVKWIRTHVYAAREQKFISQYWIHFNVYIKFSFHFFNKTMHPIKINRSINPSELLS